MLLLYCMYMGHPQSPMDPLALSPNGTCSSKTRRLICLTDVAPCQDEIHGGILIREVVCPFSLAMLLCFFSRRSESGGEGKRGERRGGERPVSLICSCCSCCCCCCCLHTCPGVCVRASERVCVLCARAMERV